MIISKDEIAQLRETYLTARARGERGTAIAHNLIQQQAKRIAALETALAIPSGEVPRVSEMALRSIEQQERIAKLERELSPLRDGSHWLAPWDAPIEQSGAPSREHGWLCRLWAELRDACLAEQAKEDAQVLEYAKAHVEDFFDRAKRAIAEQKGGR